jgi:hypothetical protein
MKGEAQRLKECIDTEAKESFPREVGSSFTRIGKAPRRVIVPPPRMARFHQHIVK